MSDIQRYYVWDENKLHLRKPTGTTTYTPIAVLLEDDHIAEVEKLTKRLESALKHSIDIQDDHTLLQAEVETTEQLKIMYKNELFVAETRIAELQRYVKELGDECKVHRNKKRNLNTIKAQGVREMLQEAWHMTGWGGDERYYAESSIKEHADKLEKGK